MDKIKEEIAKYEDNSLEKGVGLYLLERAKEDLTLANNLIKDNKSLKECAKYITGEVYKKADNKTEILFIRKKEEPNRPYVTLELCKKEIVQCYGKDNHIPDSYVKKFVKEWADKYKLNLNCWSY